jgi:hypothetical protein
MQEHIRRAHPNHYIPKLPATEESFLMMVNTPLLQSCTGHIAFASPVIGGARGKYSHLDIFCDNWNRCSADLFIRPSFFLSQLRGSRMTHMQPCLLEAH